MIAGTNIGRQAAAGKNVFRLDTADNKAGTRVIASKNIDRQAAAGKNVCRLDTAYKKAGRMVAAGTGARRQVAEEKGGRRQLRTASTGKDA